MPLLQIAISANQAWSVINFRGALIRNLIHRGHRVTVLAPKDEHFEALRSMGCACIDLPLSSKSTNPFRDIKLLFSYLRTYHRLQPDIAIHYTIKPNIFGAIAASFCGVRSLAVITGLGYTFLNTGLVPRIAQLLYRIALRLPNQVWFLNQEDRLAFISSHLVREHQAHVLPGEGCDVEHFAPRNTDIQSDGASFLLIARMLRDKGVVEFAEAARIVRRQYPTAKFRLLGNSAAENPSAVEIDQIRAWQQEGIIQYLGATDDVRSFIANSSCVVLPSYREGLPRTLMEAAAMEKPLIATDVPGCRDIVVHEQTGFLCKPMDADDLARQCLRFLELSEIQRRTLGVNARALICNYFDQRIVIDKYVEFLEKGIKEKKGQL
jgi:glycosyltransferase involved in cell wall biosynthesis